MRPILRHWPEYLIEAAGLLLFMVSAGLFGTLLEHPSSPVHAAITAPFARRCLMGLAMGLTAVGIIQSPWGRRSGAHINPAVTLTFLRLGRVAAADALGYILAQFIGGAIGVALVAALLGDAFLAGPVLGVATLPGPTGLAPAFACELLMSFGMMATVLWVSNTPRLTHATGLFAGALVATYIAVLAPVSGMSINPARTAASAMWAGTWRGAWIYFTAPVIGMLLAAELHLRLRGDVWCAKLNHAGHQRCIFRCRFGAADAPANPSLPIARPAIGPPLPTNQTPIQHHEEARS